MDSTSSVLKYLDNTVNGWENTKDLNKIARKSRNVLNIRSKSDVKMSKYCNTNSDKKPEWNKSEGCCYSRYSCFLAEHDEAQRSERKYFKSGDINIFIMRRHPRYLALWFFQAPLENPGGSAQTHKNCRRKPVGSQLSRTNDELTAWI